MIAFAETARAIADVPGRIDKVDLLAAYLRTLSDDDLAAATRFFTGTPFAAREERTLAVGSRTIIAAARAAWGVNDAELRAGYRATGDLGAALGPLVRPSLDLGLFRQTLTPAGLKAQLDAIADATGTSAGRKRQVLCERLLGACTDALEATYVTKIMTGELRIGLREGLVVEAIARAFDRDLVAVRRAASAAGDLGGVALAAKHDTLADVMIAYQAPIAFMLAAPMAYVSDFAELADAAWLVDDKYDGIRAQAHVTPDRVSIFSRTHSDVAVTFPELAAALRALPGSLILDGEIVAMRDERVLPFRFLQSRLARKDVPADLVRDVPVRYIAFDLLAIADDFLLDATLDERRGRLADALRTAPAAIVAAPWTTLEAGATAATIYERFELARVRGHEGLVFKRTDSAYTPGRRGKSWRKLKRELATLDCVVVAVERGHGRRIDVLSDYTFAVRDGANLAVIGKAYSGLTDVEIAEQTTWFDANRLPAGDAEVAYRQLGLKRGEILVAPSVVVEIAFDIVQRSTLHAGGYALRFPRIVRLRPDKGPDEIDTLERVAEIYDEMRIRERGES